MSNPFTRKFSKYKEKKQTAMAVSSVHDSKGTISSKLKRKGVTLEESKGKKRLMLLGCVDEINHLNCRHPPIPPHESPTNDANSSSVGFSKSAMERAEEVQNNLWLRFPSFIKTMLKSHVSGGFWLGLPKKFCVAHLPEQDETMALVGDNGDEYNTNYLVDKCGLSGGWRGFSMAHKLLEEDVLVFQLIEKYKFKVHIVRARSFAEIDGATTTSLPKLSFHAEPKLIKVKMEEETALITETASDNSLELVAENDENEDMGGLVDPSDSSSETMDFNNDFHINVDGLLIDAEIPLHLRKKYYELCRSQNTVLHENLMHGLKKKLAAGMISETINIADAIRAANSSTGVSHLQNWDTTLKAFEGLGMEVGFLRGRIDKLLTLSRQRQAQIELKRMERAEAIDEARRLVEKLSDVRKMILNLSAELDDLVAKNEEVMYDFREVAAAPW